MTDVEANAMLIPRVATGTPASPSAVSNLPFVVVDGGLVNQECTICFEKFKMGDHLKKLPCKHAFHTPCIAKWFRTSNTCPNCRGELPVADGSSGSRGSPGGTRNHNNNGTDDSSISDLGAVY
ncbi:E3 ubiquitin protein ligase RING1 [Tanacetum coccineum]